MKTVVEDLASRLALLHTRHAVVLGEMTPVAADRMPLDHAANFYTEAAEMLAQGLREGHPDAVGKVRAVVDPADLDSPWFWPTPLGRRLFVAGGYGDDTSIGQAFAAAILGCSRQWISQLLAQGKLSRVGGRMVQVGDVRELLRQRIDELDK